MYKGVVIARQYELAKREGRLCSRCQWIVPKKNYEAGARLCPGCEDALKGVNVQTGYGPALDEPQDKTGETL